MVCGIGGDSHEFGLRPADLHPRNVGFFQLYYQSFLEQARRWSQDGDAIRMISELVFTELYPETIAAQHAAH